MTSKDKSKDINRALAYEERKAKEHGARHIGGPGKVDFARGDKLGEVKCRESPVTKPELQHLINEKGVSIVESKGGFTQPAIEYRNRYHEDVKLISQGRKL